MNILFKHISNILFEIENIFPVPKKVNNIHSKNDFKYKNIHKKNPIINSTHITPLLIIISLFISHYPVECKQNDYRDKFYEIINSKNEKIKFNDSENSTFILNDFNQWRPKVALALSGGGSRGFTQIGILKTFEKENIPIDYIVGTSIGAVVAGMYAVGYSPFEMDSIIRNTNWNDISAIADEENRSDYFLDQKLIRDRSLLTLRFKEFRFVVPEAISVGNKFNAFLQRLIWNGVYHDNGNFNSLRIPFKAVTTDLISGETKLLNSGSLINAIKASSSIPLRYTPVRIDSMILVDGGLMANIPVKALNEFNPEIKVAVNTVSPLLKYDELDKPWNIADQVVSILMKKFSDSASIDADIYLQPDLGDHKNTDFNNLDSLINIGEIYSKQFCNQIKNKYVKILEQKINQKLSSLIKNINAIQINGFYTPDSLLLQNLNGNNPFDNSKFISILANIVTKDIYQSVIFKKLPNNSLQINAIQYDKIKKIKIFDASSSLTNISFIDINELFSDSLLNYKNFIKISESILKKLRKAGFSFSEISDVNYDYGSSELQYIITTLKIKSIKIEGAENYNFLVKRELNFSEGHTASADNLVDSWENINSLDFISNVEMNLQKDSNDSCLNVTIKVKDIGDQTIRLGLRVDNERFSQLGIDLIQENFNNLGTRLALRYSGGLRNQSVNLKAENTRIFNTFLTSALSLYYNNINKYIYQNVITSNRNKFDKKRIGETIEEQHGASVMLGSQIERKGTLSGTLRYENFRNWNDTNEIKPHFKSFATIKISTIFDTEDRTDFAVEGSLIDMSLESSLFSTKDKISFSKVYFHYHSNNSLGNHTFKPSVSFGFADITTPITEFYSIGGQDLFFGMREDEIRGRQIALASLEYRYKLPFTIFFDTYSSLRYDIGYVWENFETIKISNLQHGLGGILAFDTPVGPAKFSIGRSFFFLKNPNAVSWGPVFGYFSIGLKL